MGGQGRANAWATYSDSRIKSQQQELGSGLETIMALKPKKYLQHNSVVKNNKLIV